MGKDHGPGIKRSRETDRDKALQEAVRWLAIRSRTELEVRRRLEDRGFPADVIEDVMDKLNDLNYLNDQQFAERYVRNRLQQKVGRIRIAMELKQRGVEGELLSAALEELEDGEEQEAAIALARSRWREGEDPPRRRRRLFALLMRRGFSRSVALKAIRAVQRERGERDPDGDEEPFIFS
jgi:regulatory protein